MNVMEFGRSSQKQNRTKNKNNNIHGVFIYFGLFMAFSIIFPQAVYFLFRSGYSNGGLIMDQTFQFSEN